MVIMKSWKNDQQPKSEKAMKVHFLPGIPYVLMIEYPSKNENANALKGMQIDGEHWNNYYKELFVIVDWFYEWIP